MDATERVPPGEWHVYRTLPRNHLASGPGFVNWPPTQSHDQDSPKTPQLAHDRYRGPGPAVLPLFRQKRYQPDSPRRVRRDVRAQDFDHRSAAWDAPLYVREDTPRSLHL